MYCIFFNKIRNNSITQSNHVYCFAGKTHFKITLHGHVVIYRHMYTNLKYWGCDTHPWGRQLNISRHLWFRWRRTLMFSLICTRTHGWANHRDAGHLRRHRAHYDVTVMEGASGLGRSPQSHFWLVSDDITSVNWYRFCAWPRSKCITKMK